MRLNKPIKTIEMEVAISKLFGVRKHIIVPNISWGFHIHEIDLLVIRNSGVALEIEIKISKQDFINDLKKPHHHIDKNNRITEFYYAIPYDLYEKCKELIPKESGIIICKRNANTQRVSAVIKRKSKRIKDARKLTIDEQMKITKLGCMRIFSLKEKIIKLQYEINKK